MHVILADRLIIDKKTGKRRVGDLFRVCIEHVLCWPSNRHAGHQIINSIAGTTLCRTDGSMTQPHEAELQGVTPILPFEIKTMMSWNLY